MTISIDETADGADVLVEYLTEDKLKHTLLFYLTKDEEKWKIWTLSSGDD